jgi:hypothetical protein
VADLMKLRCHGHHTTVIHYSFLIFNFTRSETRLSHAVGP